MAEPAEQKKAIRLGDADAHWLRREFQQTRRLLRSIKRALWTLVALSSASVVLLLLLYVLERNKLL